MSGQQPFILASASPRRMELLKQVGLVPAQVIHPEIDETPLKAELPAKYALRCALEKAQVVARAHPNAIILAADTVVALGRRILPKAEAEAQAKQCLELLSGRRHSVYTGVAVVDARGVHTRMVETAVRFKRLSAEEMRAYITSGEWRGKAGGYAIQGKAAAFIPWINGSFDNVVGLPLAEVVGLLRSVRS